MEYLSAVAQRAKAEIPRSLHSGYGACAAFNRPLKIEHRKSDPSSANIGLHLRTLGHPLEEDAEYLSAVAQGAKAE